MTHPAVSWLFTRPAAFGLLLLLWLRLRWLLAQPLDAAAIATTTDTIIAVACMALTLALLCVLWLGEFDEPHDYDEWQRMRWFSYATMTATAWVLYDGIQTGEPLWKLGVIGGVLGLITLSGARAAVPKPKERLRGQPRAKAYLVVTLDLRRDPPTLCRAHVFSCNADGLTTIHGEELNLDVMDHSGNSFEEARRELLGRARLYYPYLMPHLERSGERLEPST